MAGKLGALRMLMEAAEKPLSQIRDVGAAFIERNPLSYFETFRHPAEDTVDAAKKYGVKFEPMGRNKMAVGLPDDSYNFYVAQVTPEQFVKESFGESPSLQRVLKSLDPHSLYQIDAQETGIGSNVGSRLYPAILDAVSGGMGRTNIPTQLTSVNEMRRSMNTMDAILRNPKLVDTVLPIDQQLDKIRITPEDYMAMDKQGRVGALALAHAAKALGRMDEVRKNAPTYMNPEPYINALRSFDSLTSLSPKKDFASQNLSPLFSRGVGASTLKRMNIVDAILSDRKINPDLWSGLGKKRGGLINSRC